jgi:hypothetical protein
MYFLESDIFGIIVIFLSILVVGVLAYRNKSRRKEMMALKMRREIVTARLKKIVEGRGYTEIIDNEKRTAI